jgi:predicted N-acetyltransferase YhbS
VPAAPHHVSELGRICFEAFRDIATRHGSPPDFPTAAIGQRIIDYMVQRPEDYYGVVALVDGAPVGSNFLSRLDPVAGVGPITVDLGFQGRGIGRALMENVLAYARRSDVECVRLVQDSFNMASLSLYAALGFEVKEAVALLQAAPAVVADPTIRPLTEADLPTVAALSSRIYKVSRRNEVATAVRHDATVLLREREGCVAGYLIPGMPGHGVAETDDDAVRLAGEAARRSPATPTRFFCPLREAGLYRAALRAGCRTIKVMNLMALGPYEPPDEVWMPSVLY